MRKRVRCRYGPAPTGGLHIGAARSALFIYLFAKSQGGEFILRIDDTDRAKSADHHVREAIETLTWLGIKWDEGPIYQSHRFDLYRSYIRQLIDRGHAYHDGQAVRFRIRSGRSGFTDLIHGTVHEDISKYDGFVIQRSDGTPTYQVATVVDDHLMGITHVPRGNDLFRSTHLQIALYQALDWTPPLFAHIPLVTGPDGKKLSKRHGATGVREFRENLYLPESLLYYLSTLGWSPGGQRGILPLPQMEEYFHYTQIGKKNVMFDISRLNWVNRQCLKKKDLNELSQRLFDILVRRNTIPMTYEFTRFSEIVKLLTPRYYSNCDEFIGNAEYLLNNSVAYDPTHAVAVNASALGELMNEVEGIEDFSYSNIDGAIRNCAEKQGMPFAAMVQFLRYAISGRSVTPDIIKVMLILGKNEVLQRIKSFADSHQPDLCGREKGAES